MSTNITFKINGVSYEVDKSKVLPDTSLNTFIRENAKLFGTKFMCLEGGCGACIVTLNFIHPFNKVQTSHAVNSCLFPVYSCHNMEITTIEGLGNRKTGYDTIQRRLADFNGTQCGFCSPGMIMNMNSLLKSNPQISMEEVENSFGGNICRCTGYRPILDAFKSLAINADAKLLSLCNDIEDTPNKTCPSTGKPCGGTCKPENVFLPFDNNKEWYKVYSTDDIFGIFNTIGQRPYILVSGNTAHGVYRRDLNIEIFIDINSIESLHSFKIGDTLEIGGNVSLTDAMTILKKAATLSSNFEYCKEIVKHIDLIANVPVRNTGTLAGNLSIKHQHNEFPSDVFLCLETVGAKLTIKQSPTLVKIVTVKEYLALNMSKCIITLITLPALPNSRYTLRTYKIMPRAQNAHAYINAGFLFEFAADKNKIVSARICYGGINPNFVHAFETERMLTGRFLYTNDTIQSALRSLEHEIHPDWVLPDASPEYRKKLAISLFYKAVLSISPTALVLSKYKSGGELLQRPISSGTQSYDTYPDKYPVSQVVKKIEANIQCSGEARYINDIPKQPYELWAAFVLAKKVNGKIIGFDPAPALAIPGVKTFYSAKHIPGKNSFTPPGMLFILENEEVLCSETVLYNGQPAGIILAETMEQAQYASEQVIIKYSTTLESSIDDIPTTIHDVLKNNQTQRIKEIPMMRRTATKTVEGVGVTCKIADRYEVGSQYHFSMETQTCVCIPADDILEVYSSTQWIDIVQVSISECLNIPANKIDLQVRRLGGGFGAKISRATQIACACALAAHLSNRPIRFVLSLEQNMQAIGRRSTCISDYEVEFDSNGKILNLKNVYYQDRGCSMNEPVEFFTGPGFTNCYDTSTWNVTANAVLTSAPSTTWIRAPGTLEGIFMIENIMEHMTKVCGKTPHAVRLANMPTAHPMRQMMSDFLVTSQFDSRKAAIDTFNTNNRWKKRGLGLSAINFEMIYFGSIPIHVQILHGDGSVTITHNGIEMGQGMNTKAAQVAAYILGIPLEKIAIKPSNSNVVGNATLTGGSIGSETICHGVKMACEQLKANIQPIKATMPTGTWNEVVEASFAAGVELATMYLYRAIDFDGRNYAVHGLACSEIETDLLTGNVLVKRVDILEDVGNSLSPSIDVGQIEGAFVMGLGLVLTEDLKYNRENGELLTKNTWHYKPPGPKDIPIDFRVAFKKNSTNPVGVMGSKATGEPAITMSCSLIFALRHALNSARKDAGLNVNEWYHLNSPCTTEKIFLAAQNMIPQFKI